MKNVINLKYIRLVSFLCSLIIPLLVVGPFLPDLILSLLSLYFLYFTIKNKIYDIYKNNYFYFFIAFCFVCILASIFSTNPFFSLKSSLPYFRIGIFALLIYFLISQDKKILLYFYYSFLITFSILIFDGYFQYITGYNIFGYKMASMRVSSFFKDELTLGSYLARFFPLFFALFVAKVKKNNFEIFGVSVLFILIDVLIFLSGERAAFALLNLSTLFIVIFISKYKWLRISIFIISISIVSYLVKYDNRYYNRFIKNPYISMGLNKVDSEKYIFSKSYDTIYKNAWKMFLDKPVLGHGPRMYRIKCNIDNFTKNLTPCHTHPHNFYLQLLAETGLFGFSFLFGLFIYFFYLMGIHSLKYLKEKKLTLSDYQICLLGGLLISIWPITSNGNFFNNNLMMFYGLQIGFFRYKVEF